MHIALRMDETLAANIHTHVYDPFFTFWSCLAAEEYQIARLQVGEIGCNVYMLAHISLLGSITWYNDVVHKSMVRMNPLQSTPFDEVPAQR